MNGRAKQRNTLNESCGAGLINNPTPKGAAICISATLLDEKYSSRANDFSSAAFALLTPAIGSSSNLPTILH
jgi:hypothetical protein